MFTGIGLVQFALLMLLGTAALGAELYALVDALRTRADAFAATGKLTKNKWVIILAVASALGVISYPLTGGQGPLTWYGLIAVVAAAVYLVDVRPAVRQIRGGGAGRGGQMGPYGPW
jgi:hypothetical protein